MIERTRVCPSLKICDPVGGDPPFPQRDKKATQLLLGSR